MEIIGKLIGKLLGKSLRFAFLVPAILLGKAGFYNLNILIRLAVYSAVGLLFGWGSLESIATAAIIVAVASELGGRAVNSGEDGSPDHVRGNQLVDTKTVAKMTRTEDCRFMLGSVGIPKKFETRHFLFAGTTGSGKTRLYHQVLQPTRDSDSRAVVVDIGGAMISRYYRGEGSSDIVFNPKDERGIQWSPLAEILDEDDIPLIAKALIPDGEGSGNKEWNRYAQQIVQGVLRFAWMTGADNQEMLRLLSRADTEELRECVKDLPVAGMFREGNERMMSNVMGIVSSYAGTVAMLDPAAGADSFSISRWIMSDTKGEWLFMNFSDRHIEAMRPLLTAVVGLAISATLSLKEDSERRLFFVLDEFDALGEISGIKSLLTRGRRFGASAIIAIQSVSQLYECYGRDVANTLLSNLGTQVILRLPDAETAEWASRTFGDEQIREEHISTSTNHQFENSTSNSFQIRQQRVVLPSEIQQLPDLVALLNVVGDTPPCVVHIPPVNPPQIHEEFVKKTS